jgi:hypothetical protein
MDDNTSDDDSDPGRPPPAVLELPQVYDALSHPRRRYVCHLLPEDDRWSVAELAGRIAAWEAGVPGDAVAEYRRERVAVSLYHSHLPKLAADDVVDFDDATGTVTAAGNADTVLTALDGIAARLDDADEGE